MIVIKSSTIIVNAANKGFQIYGWNTILYILGNYTVS